MSRARPRWWAWIAAVLVGLLLVGVGIAISFLVEGAGPASVAVRVREVVVELEPGAAGGRLSILSGGAGLAEEVSATVSILGKAARPRFLLLVDVEPQAPAAVSFPFQVHSAHYEVRSEQRLVAEGRWKPATPVRAKGSTLSLELPLEISEGALVEGLIRGAVRGGLPRVQVEGEVEASVPPFDSTFRVPFVVDRVQMGRERKER